MFAPIFFTAIVLQLAMLTLTPSPRIPPYLPVPPGAAVIMRTGSTNFSGFRIVLQPSGDAEWASGTERSTQSIPANLAARLFADLGSAKPLQQLPIQACMKSASFGSSLFVYWEHQRSGDLSCAGDARGRALAADAQAIADALHIRLGPVMIRPMLPNEYHRPVPTPP